MKRYSALGCWGDHCKWWASSTINKSKSAADTCFARLGCAISQSNAQIINASLSNGFRSAVSSVASKSIARSSSNSEKCRLNRRNISTSHWCCKFSGTIISTRSVLPDKSCCCKIIPASIVLPSPTSSASNTRG